MKERERGRKGPVPWPTASPDLKQLVYEKDINNTEVIRQPVMEDLIPIYNGLEYLKVSAKDLADKCMRV